jgi:hypothetical protein
MTELEIEIHPQRAEAFYLAFAPFRAKQTPMLFSLSAFFGLIASVACFAQPTFSDLASAEESLLRQYEAFTEKWGTADEFNARLSTKLDSLPLTEDERVALRGKGTSRRRGAGAPPASLAPLVLELERYDSDLELFHDAYDVFIHEKTVFLVDRYWSIAHAAIDEVPEDSAIRAPLLALFKQLEEERNAFLTALTAQAADVGDPNRLVGTRPFAQTLVKFWVLLSTPDRTLKERVQFRIQRLSKAAQSVLGFLALLPEAPFAYRDLKNNRPAVGSFGPAISRATRWAGFRNHFTDLSPLTTPPPSGVVRFITQAHAHGLLDASSTVQFPLERAKIVNAPTFWAPAALVPALLQNDQQMCVYVPNAPDPNVALIRALEANRCDTVFIMPEGALGTGLSFEIRRPAQPFAEGMLSLLRRKGFGIEIVSVSIPRHHQAFHDHLQSHPAFPKDLITRIHPPLAPLLTDTMMQYVAPQSVSRWIRQTWFDSVALDSVFHDRILGSPPISDLIEILDGYLTSQAVCAETLAKLPQWANPTAND